MTIFIRSSRAPRKMANDPRSKTTDLAYIFRHFDLHDLIFFGHFKNVSVCYRKMTAKNTQSTDIFVWSYKVIFSEK